MTPLIRTIDRFAQLRNRDDATSDDVGADVMVERGLGGWTTSIRGLIGFLAFFVACAAPAYFGLSPYWLYVSTQTVVFVLAIAGLNLILGYAGQISMAHAAFMALGAYCVALLGGDLSWPLLPSLAIGGLAGFLLGMLLGLPALRVSLHYLAMVTLGFQVAFILFSNNLRGLTNGAQGIADVERSGLGGSIATDGYYHLFACTVVVICLLGVWFVLNSTWGRAFRSIRLNPKRAASLGVRVGLYKVLAFAIGSAMASVAGGLMGPLTGYVDPTSFPIELSFQMMLAVVIGGSGRLEGAVFGALLIIVVPEALRAAEGVYLVIFGLIALGVLVYVPQGLTQLFDVLWVRVFRRRPLRLTK